MRKTKLLASVVVAAPAALALVLLQPATHSSAQTSGPERAAQPQRTDSDDQRIDDLVIANHILADQGVLDGFGHISVRSMKNPKHFYMSQSRSAGVVTRDDIMEFDENSQPVDQRGRPMFGERFIHGEIYRARLDVQAVVHSHTPEVLPFGVIKQPMQAMIHMGAFIGATPVPVFEIRNVEGVKNQILVSNNKSGAALAKVLGNRNVVLMRGHGMSVVADNAPGGPARWVAFRAYYTQINARAEAEAIKLGGRPEFLNEYEVNRTDNIDRWWGNFAALAKAHAYVDTDPAR